MAAGRNPSGLPGGRIIRPMYGPLEIDADQRVGMQIAGLLRVRRTLLLICGLVAALALAVAIFGNSNSAAGIAMVWLAPLLFFLVILQAILVVTRTKPRRPGRR